MEDCKAALLADPHVPRSRLKLGVPFVGKDVPSKSSEFAHPDVIIGLTVLAFRCVCEPAVDIDECSSYWHRVTDILAFAKTTSLTSSTR
jgi:hypothetical protein